MSKTKTEIIKELAAKTGLTIGKVKEFLDAQAEMATDELKTGASYILPGIGKLKVDTPSPNQRFGSGFSGNA